MEPEENTFSQEETFSAQPLNQGGDNTPFSSSPIKQKMLVNLEKHLGIVSYAAKETGIHRSTHYVWLDADGEYRKAVEELTQTLLDYAEARLFDLVRKRDLKAIEFLLSTRGRSRGYGKFKNDAAANTGAKYLCQLPDGRTFELLSRV